MNPMYITFAIYLVAVLLIGLAAYFSTRNFDDYILGGRSLGPFVTAMSAGASDMSGWLLMGLPGAIYLSGLNEAWIAIGLIVGAYLNWLLVAGRLRVHTEYANNALTLPDYFFHRFGAGGHLMKVVSALIILVLLHYLLCFGHRSRCYPVPKPVPRYVLHSSHVAGCRRDHRLHLLGWFLGCKLDRYPASFFDDFCIGTDSCNGVLGFGRRRSNERSHPTSCRFYR